MHRRTTKTDFHPALADAIGRREPGVRQGRPQVVYLAHDANDSRVLHRARGLAALDLDFTLMAFRRSKLPTLSRGSWRTIDLGETYDYAYLQRVTSLIRAVSPLWQHRKSLLRADALIARNIEQLLLALLLRVILVRRVPLAYECLDIHRLMVGSGVKSRLFRQAERFLLRFCDQLIVSSPAYVESYFGPVQGYSGDWRLLENKMPASYLQVSRPAAKTAPDDRPISIGWFGMLRCVKSLEILLALADARPNAVRIVIYGMPTEFSCDALRERIGNRSNVYYGGAYRNPEDLAGMYDKIDLSWAIDFYEEGFCSQWLLPNRLYESGFFGVPLLTRAGTATAKRTTDLGIGWTLEEPLVGNALDFLDHLTVADYRSVSNRIAAAPVSLFVEKDEPATLLNELIA